MMRVSRRYFLASALIFLSACMYSRGPQQPEEATTLKVDNQSIADMTIYAVRGGQRIRLGLATGLRVSTFTIPSSLIFGATPLKFLADPIGSNRLPVSDEITVSPGDVVTLTIPAQ
jgi:hypothetical protein